MAGRLGGGLPQRPLVDIAQLCNWFGQGEAGEAVLFDAYLGRAATPEEQARLLLMREVCRAYYAAVLMGSAAPGGWMPDGAERTLQAPPLAEVYAAIGEGRLDLSQPAGRFIFGKAMLNQMLAELDEPRGQAALRLMTA